MQVENICRVSALLENGQLTVGNAFDCPPASVAWQLFSVQSRLPLSKSAGPWKQQSGNLAACLREARNRAMDYGFVLKLAVAPLALLAVAALLGWFFRRSILRSMNLSVVGIPLDRQRPAAIQIAPRLAPLSIRR